jgi:methylmalonyl-CoA/ethylmalonyl-CoA epimerase
MVKKIDHIAIAVKDIEKEIDRYVNILGLPLIHREVVEEQKVKVAVFAAGEVNIELLEPLDTDSPIASFLQKRGGGLHHIALEVEDLNTQIRRLREKGVTLLNQTPQRGADNSLIAFLHPNHFSKVLLELVEKSPK